MCVFCASNTFHFPSETPPRKRKNSLHTLSLHTRTTKFERGAVGHFIHQQFSGVDRSQIVTSHWHVSGAGSHLSRHYWYSFVFSLQLCCLVQSCRESRVDFELNSFFPDWITCFRNGHVFLDQRFASPFPFSVGWRSFLDVAVLSLGVAWVREWGECTFYRYGCSNHFFEPALSHALRNIRPNSKQENTHIDRFQSVFYLETKSTSIQAQ